MGEKMEERRQIYEDVRNGIIPKRVPLEIEIEPEFYIQMHGDDLCRSQWTEEGIEEGMDQVFSQLEIDMLAPVKARNPATLEIIGSNTYAMGTDGFIQHPEKSFMDEDDYDAFIENPHEFYMEHSMKRLCRNLGDDPIRNAMVLAMGLKAEQDYTGAIGGCRGRASAKNEIFAVPFNNIAFADAPCDFVADRLRGFTAFSMDVKRRRDKVKAAAEALLPLMVKQALPAQVSDIGYTALFTHMPAFMRTKEFEELYWPTFSGLLHATAEKGQYFCVFLESDWTRYIDYLQDLPQGTILRLEQGDLQQYKDKLGKKFILEGMYPLEYLKYATKEQAVDKAKEMLDIMMPGGNYIFGFDKGPIKPADIKFENFQAVIQYVAENGNYRNAGEKSMPEDPKNSIHKCLDQIPSFHSKYYVSKEDYLTQINYPVSGMNEIVAGKLSQYEDWVFNGLNALK